MFKYLSILLFVTARGQNVTINGRAHKSHAGKPVQLYSVSDYITGFQIKQSTDTVGSDGYFELPYYADKTQQVFIKIENAVATLHVQPDFVYGITFPEIDQDKNLNHDVEIIVNIGVLGNDSTETNALVFDFDSLYNRLFSGRSGQYLSRASMFRRCDSLQKLCDKRYAGIKNDYFKNHVRYRIASVNASLSRGEKYLMEAYISRKPILYQQGDYMLFFKTYFNGYLARIASQRKGQSLYNIINSRADYPTLLNFVRYEKELGNDSLRELIILREMWEYYFSKDFDPDAIARIISQLHGQTKIAEHRHISANMLAFINKLQVGSPAPPFQATSRDNKVVNSTMFKGRWVYLNFFSTKNVQSLKEMPKIAGLKKKFGDKLLFVSVCLDDSISDYRDYLKANPKFDWLIVHGTSKDPLLKAKEKYFVTGTEAYFLISNFGLLAASPAPSPSQGIEYKLNLIFKVRQRNTKTGIR